MNILVAIVIGLAFSCASVWAQATAQIHGMVQDSSGAAIAGAEVKATQTATGAVRTVMSSSDGSYVLTNLPTGVYQLEVTKEGFAKAVQNGIELQVNADPAIDIALKVGQVSEAVNVEANAALVETRGTAVGSVIETQRILELPLNGRDTTSLITLAGAAVVTGAARQALFLNLNYISIGGQALFGTDYTLDGAMHTNFLTGTYMPLAFPDAVQEFKVESSGQTAQRGASSSVSVVTRSGGNDLHGDLFYFIRNDGFGSAREYFTPKASTYKRNQFGGTVGGPIIKNKLFYFGGFQETIRHENPDNSIANVPTQAMLNGDWTAFASAACNGGTAKTLAAPFVGNKIDPSLYVQPAVFETNFLLKTVAQDGITPNQCGAITYNTPSYETDHQYVGKVDYQLTDKQSLFFRLLTTQQYVPNSFSVDPIILNWTNTGLDQLANSLAFGDTYLFSPSVVNSFRAAWNRTAHRYIPNLAFSHCTAGVNMWCDANPQTIGAMSITGGFTMGSTSAANEYWTGTAYALNDDVSWVRGAHQMTFGAGAWQGRVAEFTHFASTSQLNFNGAGLQSSGGLGMADFFLGKVNTFFQGLPNTNYSREQSVDLYFTDTWKLNSRLTVNFGVRWEPFLPMHAPQISNFDMNRFLNGVRSTVFLKAPLGFYFPGDPGFPGDTGAYKQWDHFDPRGGIAWDPKGDGKMSIRASYAFGYAYVPGIQREDQAGSNPWGGRTTLTNPPGGFVNPWQGFTGGNPFPYAVSPNVLFTPRGQFISSPYNLPTPNTYTWNVALQRQIGNTWVASASYIGSRVMHLYNNVAINYAQMVNGPIVTSGCASTAINCNSTANTDARRLLSLLNPTEGQYVGNMDAWDPSGTQTYHALYMTAEKRLSRGVNMKANWTWSHCIGSFSGYNSKTDQTVTAPGNPLFDRGNCDSDRRHIVNITAVALSPRFSNTVLRTVGSNWQLAGIYSFRSGMPLAIQDGTDRELTGINHQRPNVVNPAAVYTGQSGPSSRYLNPAAFAAQPLGTVGNLGWNALTGPTYWDIDLALSREFPIREKTRLQLRADAFNLTNSFVSNPASTASPTSAAVPAFENLNGANLFGILNAAQPTRKMQFALKYTF